jgi:CheY-like chemotaxis protein
MNILVLEDDPARVKFFKNKFIGHIVDYTDDANVAVEFIKSQEYDYIYLDHDLGGEQLKWDEENCGMVVAKYIEENPLPEKTAVIIHSFNVVAAQRMLRIIPHSVYVPGIWTQKGLP